MRKIRVLVANRPRLLRDLVLQTLLDQPDFEIVGEPHGDNDVVELVDRTRPDYLIISMEELDSRPALCGFLLGRYPQMKLLALASGGGNSVCYWVYLNNQPGIAKGHFPAAMLVKFERKLLAALKPAGAHVDAIYYCLHHPRGTVKKLRRSCTCRKPAIGLFTRAARDWKISLGDSYMVGDGIQTSRRETPPAAERSLWVAGNANTASSSGLQDRIPHFAQMICGRLPTSSSANTPTFPTGSSLSIAIGLAAKATPEYHLSRSFTCELACTLILAQYVSCPLLLRFTKLSYLPQGWGHAFFPRPRWFRRSYCPSLASP